MTVLVRFYSYFKDLTGVDSIKETIPDGATIGDLTARVHERFPKLSGTSRSTLIAVGVEYAPPTQVLRDGDHVSFFPPVQGG